ncbi:MAG: hypothetical protein ACJ763_04950 [Bdellovibrionia bacterium]
MGRLTAGLALGILCLSASSCDFIDAMSATKTMPQKIDETNDQVTQTNRKIDTTNTTMVGMKIDLEAMTSIMEAMNGALGLMHDSLKEMHSSLESMQKTMEEMRQATSDMRTSTAAMNDKMNETIHAIAETNRKMEKVNSAIHKQTLVVALTEMMKSENTQYLFPPTGMMPAGQTFADEATSDEVVQLVYVTLKDIDEVQPQTTLSAKEAEDLDHKKLSKFTSLEVIAGLMSQESVEEAVRHEIKGGGRYDTTVYKLLMLRTLLVKSILIEEDLFSVKLDDLGKIQEAIKRISELDWIARLPFADQIGVKTRGMLNSDNNVEEKLDPKMTVSMWNRLALALKSELDPAKVGNSEEAQARVAQFKATVKSYQDYWSGH